MKQPSKRAGYRQNKPDAGNEHLGLNEARYHGRAYNQDRNQNRREWDEDYKPRHNQYPDNERQGNHRYNQQRYGSPKPGNNLSYDNDPGYVNNYRQDRQSYNQSQNQVNAPNDQDRIEDINADRRIQGSRNYLREEHAYGQSNDRMYEADRGKRNNRQNYQDDYNYNNNAQYPYRDNLDAYDTHFNNPENFRKERRRGFGSRYER
ncbi:MAG: hypothetical protein JNM21_14065 [Taibaiella sp.]|nr:hypothetical protein [Taibaiella sp.]